MTRRLLILWTTLVAVLVAGNEKIAPDLRAMPKADNVDVIIQYQNQPGQAQRDKVQAKGGAFKADLRAIKSAVYSVPVVALDSLALDADIRYVSPDRPARATLNNSSVAVNAPIAWQYGWDGSGIGVAVIDSGYGETTDLSARVVYKEAFGSQAGTNDQYGHGTVVAGVAGGDGTNSSGLYKGSAPKANIISLRVLDQTGAGTDSAVITAIQRAIQIKSTYNIRVLNLSLGRQVVESYKTDPLCQAVEAAWRAGIVVVVAAGNNGRDNSMGTDGYGTINSPANDPYVITVGAMKSMDTPSRADDLVAGYSSKGPTAIDHIGWSNTSAALPSRDLGNECGATRRGTLWRTEQRSG